MGLDKSARRSYQACIQTYRRLYGTRGELITARWTGLADVAFTNKEYGTALKLVQQALLAATVLFADSRPSMNPAADDSKARKALYEALHLKGRIWSGIYAQTQSVGALKRVYELRKVESRVNFVVAK